MITAELIRHDRTVYAAEQTVRDALAQHLPWLVAPVRTEGELEEIAGEVLRWARASGAFDGWHLPPPEIRINSTRMLAKIVLEFTCQGPRVRIYMSKRYREGRSRAALTHELAHYIDWSRIRSIEDMDARAGWWHDARWAAIHVLLAEYFGYGSVLWSAYRACGVPMDEAQLARGRFRKPALKAAG